MGCPVTVVRLKQLVHKFNPDFLCLQETICNRVKLDRKLRWSSFDSIVSIDPVGRSGGLCLLWKQPLSFDLINISHNWIHGYLSGPNNSKILFIVVYGPPNLHNRNKLWDFLHSQSNNSIPWLLIGDFNQVLWRSDKLSTCKSCKGAENFQDTLETVGLVELPNKGIHYTWTNNREGEEEVWEKLDRALGNLSCIKHSRRSFKFEAMWYKNPECSQIISSSWALHSQGSQAFKVVQKLKSTARNLSTWNRLNYNNLSVRIRQKEEDLRVVQNLIHDPSSRVRERQIRKDLEHLLDCEQTIWAQRARQLWLAHGDRNTRSLILKKSSKTCVQYFKDIFTDSSNGNRDECRQFIFEAGITKLSAGQRDILNRPFTKLEIETTVFQMDGSKAPGPDREMEFPDHWISILMQCITTPTLRIMVNGEPTEYFSPQCGLRQGDPLSPYLFILGFNVLSCALSNLQEAGIVKGIKVARQAPAVNHLLYADDSIMFFKADLESCHHLFSTVSKFGDISDLTLNQSGLGVKNMSDFNSAMLAKQLWRIIQDPSSLFSLIMTSKYGNPILDGKFKCPSNASQSWKCLYSAKDLILPKLKWAIGSGEDIPINHPFWFQPLNTDLSVNKVKDLIHPSGFWDHQKVKDRYGDQTASQILAIKPSRHNIKDNLFWDGINSSVYSVKDGYKVALNSSGSNLLRRGYHIPGTCAFGCDTPETANHLFKECSVSRAVWFRSCLNLRSSSVPIEFYLCLRNKVLFQKERCNPDQAIHQARQLTWDKINSNLDVRDSIEAPRNIKRPECDIGDNTPNFLAYSFRRNRDRGTVWVVLAKQDHSLALVMYTVGSRKDSPVETILAGVRSFLEWAKAEEVNHISLMLDNGHICRMLSSRRCPDKKCITLFQDILSICNHLSHFHVFYSDISTPPPTLHG
ncbi:reverse transcriptase [Senna tora]|uniref:Reverse transcriptase n=1 Tax=Senna tora TaxID=362788 RepID=A0A834SG12_9FABA|nr:reverse transcriptase [Senna tora]